MLPLAQLARLLTTRAGGLLPALSCPHWRFVRQALALRRLDSQQGALSIFRIAVVVPELELAHVAVQVLLGNTVVDAVDAALNGREEALNGVGVNVAAHVFFGAVVH